MFTRIILSATTAGLALAVMIGCQHLRIGNQHASNKTQIKKSGKTSRQSADLQVSMGKLFEQQKDYARAEAAYRAALTEDSTRSDAYLRLAILHDRRGDFAGSEQLYQKAIEYSPGNPNIFCCVGYSYYVQQRWQEAEMNLRQAIAINPRHQRAHNNLGMLLARTDRTEEAKQEFHLAGCDHVDSLMNLGFAMTLDGRWDQARQSYQLALAYDPSFEDAKKAIQDLDGTVARLEDRINRTADVTRASDESAADNHIVSEPDVILTSLQVSTDLESNDSVKQDHSGAIGSEAKAQFLPVEGK